MRINMKALLPSLRLTLTPTTKPSRSIKSHLQLVRRCTAIAVVSLFSAWGTPTHAVSYSNAPANTVTLPQAQIGPGATVTLSELNTANAAYLNNNIAANITHNQTGVEVNQPIALTLSGGLIASGTNASNSYIVDSAGTVHYSRVEINNNQVILFPQIKLQPTRTYYAVFGGLLDANNNSYGNYILKFTNRDLDLGLYWYGKNGISEKYFSGYSNAFYDSSKKTVIFAHGWQASSTGAAYDEYGRPNFQFTSFYWTEDSFGNSSQYNNMHQFTSHAWIDQGWNTGIVYWTQFADEPILADGNFAGLYAAEGKIWNLAQGPQGNRYATLDANNNVIYNNWNGQFTIGTTNYTAGSVGEALSRYVIAAISGNTSGNLRLVGHSLGNQVVTHINWYLMEANIRVNRIALLDPAWTMGTKSWLPTIDSASYNLRLNWNNNRALAAWPTWVGNRYSSAQLCNVILWNYMNKYWNQGVVVERYNSSIIQALFSVNEDNTWLSKHIAVYDTQPLFYSALQLQQKHMAMRQMYFWSMEFSPPSSCVMASGTCTPNGYTVPAASNTDSYMQSIMQIWGHYTQATGEYTPTPADNMASWSAYN